ncbi:ASCH domain-containing protein [Brevibacillus centrosporus]|uniref:ASCH domain-containing protein n=1 Tax=Brevibacillus centrosporus TaxID=54910 RepID=UPI002E227066|nr:ASCH domain-containing protein [Brevibacillus centrosporus]
MKAITLHQPWATLIALGEKRFETRSWATKYRGPIAIHAAKKVDKEICQQEPFRSVLAKHGYTADNLPTGAVVAKCQLVDCHQIISTGYDAATLYAVGIPKVRDNEFAFGWYKAGRYAWEMADVKPIDPVPAKGQQGLWNWGGERDASRT